MGAGKMLVLRAKVRSRVVKSLAVETGELAARRQRPRRMERNVKLIFDKLGGFPVGKRFAWFC